MEIWKDIAWYEWRYQVSNLGNVKSLNYNHTWKEKILKLAKTRWWYIRIHLPIQWTKLKKCLLVHRLVMFAFSPEWEKPQVNHKDWNKLNNTLDNLEWNTKEENMQHSYDNFLHKKKFDKDNHLSKAINQYDLSWTLIKKWWWAAEAARFYNVYTSSIARAWHWQSKCKWFIWKYIA